MRQLAELVLRSAKAFEHRQATEIRRQFANAIALQVQDDQARAPTERLWQVSQLVELRAVR